VIAIPDRDDVVGARRGAAVVPAGFCVAGGAVAGFCVVGAGAGAGAGAWAYTLIVTTPARRELISITFRICSIIV